MYRAYENVIALLRMREIFLYIQRSPKIFLCIRGSAYKLLLLLQASAVWLSDIRGIRLKSGNKLITVRYGGLSRKLTGMKVFVGSLKACCSLC